MRAGDVGFGAFFFRITTCHMVTYMIVGFAAFTIMDYATAFSQEGSIMMPTDSPWVALGLSLQVIRGLIFALALYPFRRVFLEEPRGWLKLWGLLLGLGILSTFGPAPGSVEGMIYTRPPIADQVVGLWEVVLQSLALSVLVVLWHRSPSRTWNVVMGGLAALVVFFSVAGAVLPRPEPVEAVQDAPTEKWQCRNDLEVRCGQEGCETAAPDGFTPMSVSVEDSGKMSVCAYSGCWEGVGEVVRSGNFLTLIGHRLEFSTSPDSKADIIIAIDRTDGVATLKAGEFAHPLLCESNDATN